MLSKFDAQGLKLDLTVEVTPKGGVSIEQLDEIKSALRVLGLDDDLTSP